MPDDLARTPERPLAPAGASRSIVGWIHAGAIDAELAALAWLLLDGNVPVLVVSGEDAAGRAGHVAAIAGMLSPSQPMARIHQASDVAGLAAASELGWLAEVDSGAPRPGDPLPVVPASDDTVRPPAVLVADDLGPALGRRWRAAVRVLVRAPSRGYGLVSSIGAGSLESVYATLGSLQTALREDEISYLGVVLVVEAPEPGTNKGGATGDEGDKEAGEAARESAREARVTIAHYLRPVARDAHGHVQRLGPAVLASRDATADRLEHFAWGIYPELAARIGMRSGDLETELGRRAEYLTGLVRAGVVGREAVATALDGYRRAAAVPHSH